MPLYSLAIVIEAALQQRISNEPFQSPQIYESDLTTWVLAYTAEKYLLK
jgi:hypothetical protein